MTSLTDDQRRLLRKMGSWPIADALLDPESGCAHLRTSWWGGSYGDGDHFQCANRGVEVYGYDQADADDYTRTIRFEVRYSAIAAYARTLPSSVREELRAARAHHQAVHVERWQRTTPPIGKTGTPPADDEWDAHMAVWRPAVARLNAALDAALPLEVAEPLQLDLFAAVAS